MKKDLWNNFWFKAGYEKELGLFRIFYYLALLIYIFYSLQFDTRFADQMFFHPTPIYNLFSLPYFTGYSLLFIKHLCYLFIVLSLIGFCTPIVTLLTCVCSYLYLSQWYNFGYHHHMDSPLMISILIMAFAPCGAYFSVDAILSRRFSRWPFRYTQNPTAEYYWPFAFLQVIWSFVFFSALIIKFYYTGITWFENNILQILFMRLDYYYNNLARTPWPFLSTELRHYLMENPLLCYVSTFFMLLLELCMPLALFFKGYVRLFLIVSGMLMLLGVYVLMGHRFIYSMLPLALAWLPWTKYVELTQRFKFNFKGENKSIHLKTPAGPA